MKRRVAGLIVILALVTPSCVNVRENLGISLVSGRIVLRYVVCDPGEALRAIALARPIGEPPWSGYERVILWRVETRHARRTKFQVGVTPPGFEEVVPLKHPLPTAGSLGVVIDRTDYRNEQAFFSLDDLREGSIYRPDRTGHVTVREFYADACG